jgi:hypothetical protein
MVTLMFLILVPNVNAQLKYTPLETVKYYDNNIETRMYFDGANYIYITPYGNYTFYHPDNIMSFTDFLGNEVISESTFILQHNKWGTWEVLIDYYDTQGNPTVTIANNTYFEVKYNVYDKKRIIANTTLTFKVNKDNSIKPKITINTDLTNEWDFGELRYIWDLIPSNTHKYVYNETLENYVDINTISGLKDFNNNTKKNKIKLETLNYDMPNSIIDISDYGETYFYAGDEPYYNSKGIIVIFPINETDIEPITYTEDITLIPLNAIGGLGEWRKTNITSYGIPSNSVVEIILLNNIPVGTAQVGIREVGSSLNRQIEINEAEDGGFTANRFLSNVNGSGFVEFWRDNVDSYVGRFVGYWENVNFTEQWETYQVTNAEDNMWHETDGTELSLVADKTHLITITNDDAGTEYLGGVRNTTSTINRYVDIMESEGGGNQTTSMYVAVDSNAKIDVYSEQFNDIWFINQGYFNVMLFRELWWWTPALSDNDSWRTEGLTTLIPINGTIVDFISKNRDAGQENSIGVRINGSSLERRINIREAESGGVSSYGMSVGTDENGFIEIYQPNFDVSNPRYYLTGYFFSPPYIPTIIPPTLLYGVGYNSTPNGYVIIMWSHNDTGDIDNFEIYYSTDNITYISLALTANKEYNHTGLTNGNYYYYMVRTTFFNSTWFNSTFTPINLERVWFAVSAGAGATIGLFNNFIIMGFLSIIAVVGLILKGVKIKW